MNFEYSPSDYEIYPGNKEEKADLDICLFKDHEGAISNRISRGRLKDCVVGECVNQLLQKYRI